MKMERKNSPIRFVRVGLFVCAPGMRDYLAVKVRYRLGSRNC